MKRRRQLSSTDDEPDFSGTIQCEGTQISHIWTIHQYSYLFSMIQGIKKLRSPVFPININGRMYKWFLELKVNNKDYYKNSDARRSDTSSSEEENDAYLSLYLHLDSSNTESVTAVFSLSLLDKKLGQLTFMRKSYHDFSEGPSGKCAGFKDFVKDKDDFFKSDGLLHDDSLRIKCKITVGEKETGFISSPTNKVDSIHESKLANQLKSLFDRKVMSDVSVCAGDKKFSAHKAILAARSSVLAATFEYDLNEMRGSKVTIKDIKPDVVEEMLRFIYTDESPNLKDMTQDLLVAADKYNIVLLKKMCEEVLSGEEITMNNAAEILSLANLGNSKVLEDQVTAFIAFRATDLMKTDSWKKMLMNNQGLVLKAIKQASKLKVDSTSEPINQ